MKFVVVDDVWRVKLSFQNETISFSELVHRFKDYQPFELHDGSLEENFLNSENYFLSEKDKSGKYVPSPAFSKSFFDIWFDYVQARIYKLKTDSFREENNYSLKDGKHVKLIDKYGETVLKDLKDIMA